MIDLGDRMKGYENIERKFLYRRMPVIIRLDGKAFHTFTKDCNKPFDKNIIDAMADTGEYLLNEIQGCKIAYIQSDEINLFLSDYDQLETCAWFGNNLNKIVSISASMASTRFTLNYHLANYGFYMDETGIKIGIFDSRAFNIPKEEVINLFRWRYLDWQRNSVQMLAQSLFSHKELHGKNQRILREMCLGSNNSWDDLDPQFKNGTLFIKEKDNERLVSKKFTDFNLLSYEWFSRINNIVGVNYGE